MKMDGGQEVQLDAGLTSALDKGEWTASHPGRFTPRKMTPIPSGQEPGWAPEPVLSVWRRENLVPLAEIEPQFLGCPARSFVTATFCLK
jgi:hypothetical protein